jgi:hypothetical protein
MQTEEEANIIKKARDHAWRLSELTGCTFYEREGTVIVRNPEALIAALSTSPPPTKIEYFSEEDKALASAVELLREAAAACDAADPQASDAILSLAHDLAASVVANS